ncbi:hypothetical protein [Flavobacterium flavigenum]|uniref:hypothetical protein n=1 Tax=Flavobacterium flavigenum TaxID=3003258 RepID=UPI003D79696A
MKLTKTFNAFFENEKSSGLLLLFVTVLSLTIANLSLTQNSLLFGKKIWVDIPSHTGLMTD